MVLNNKIVTQVFSLGLIEITNILIPLLIFPYVVRTIGLSSYGHLTLATTISSFFLVLFDYSFSLVQTKQVAKNIHDKYKLSELFSTVTYIKLFFGVMVLSFYLLILFSCSYFDGIRGMFIFSALAVWFQSMLPIWFFVGVQESRYFSIFNAVAKILVSIAIFLLVKLPKDAFMVPLLNSIGFLLSFMMSIFYVIRSHKIQILAPNIVPIKAIIVDGFKVTLSRISVTIYSQISILLLARYVTVETLGAFGIVRRITDIVPRLLSPVTNTLFPDLARLFETSTSKFYKLIYRIIGFNFIVSLLILISLLFLKNFILVDVFKVEDIRLSSFIYVTLLPVILVSPLGIIVTYALIAMNLEKLYTRSININAIMAIIFGIILVKYFELYGVIILSYLTQAGVILYFLLNIKFYEKSFKGQDIS